MGAEAVAVGVIILLSKPHQAVFCVELYLWWQVMLPIARHRRGVGELPGCRRRRGGGCG